MTRFTVNGLAVHYRLDPETPLLWALRDASNLTGAKYGCGTGHCGACTVHVDGRAVRSCQVRIADLEGRLVVTIEGLSRDRSHPVQQAWVANSVPQCGYCQPGMIMAAAALIEHSPSPSDAEIDGAIGNICRCGTYPRVREALRRAIRVRSGQEQIAGAPPPGIAPEDAAREVRSLVPAERPRRRRPR
jgi:isoquinoline 1-oxidoreductase alpha subunit